MKKDKIVSIINNRIDGYLEAAIEVYPTLRELFENNSALRNLMKATAVKGIQWYLQELWHPSAEEPIQKGLVLQYSNVDNKDYCQPINWREVCEEVTEELKKSNLLIKSTSIDEQLREILNLHWRSKNTGIKWCYLSDILPKERDKQ